MTGIEGCLGNKQLSYFGGQAYQADLYPDKDELTLRMNIVSILRGVGQAIGSKLTAVLSVQVGLIMWISVGNTVIFVAYLYLFFWIVQIPPGAIEKARNEYVIEIVGDRQRVNTILGTAELSTSTKKTDESEENNNVTLLQSLKDIGGEFKSAYQVFSKPRPGYKRACLWVMAAVGFVSTLAGQEGYAVLGQYTYFELGCAFWAFIRLVC